MLNAWQICSKPLTPIETFNSIIVSLSLNRPIVFFDIESTGLHVTKDRIVELALLKVFPDASQESLTFRINPGIPIAPEATAVHGISNEDVVFEPRFEQLAPRIFEFIEGCDLGGFNALRFDIPMLMEEFLRVGMDIGIESREVIDVQVIFHKMEERTLSAAYRFYCNKNLEDAHSAKADTLATWEVFKAQTERYDSLPKSIAEIAKFTGNDKRVDLEGRLVKNDAGEIVFNFGKHRGKPVADVFAREPGYYNWMMEGDFPAYTKKMITQIRMAK